MKTVKSTMLTALLLGCILSVVVSFEIHNIDQEIFKDVEQVETSRGLQLIKKRTFYQNNVCFHIFFSKKILSQTKNETDFCIESQEKSVRANFMEFKNKIAAIRQKLLNVCDQEEDSTKYSECFDRTESQLIDEVNSKKSEFLIKQRNIIKDKQDCVSKSIHQRKVETTSALSDLNICLKNPPELNLDSLKIIYRTLRTCVQGGRDDFDTCLKKNMVAINGQKDYLREIASKYWEEINAFDVKENSCLRHFLVGNIFPDFTFAFDFEKCLKSGFNAVRIQGYDDEGLAHGFQKLHNELLACRIDLNKTNIEKCISEMLVDSEEANFIEWSLQRLSVEDLQKSCNKMQEVFINDYDCSGYIFEKLKFRGLSMNGTAKEELNKCMDKFYVSNTKLPTMNDAVSKLKRIEMSLRKCIQYRNGAQLSDCFAKIIDDSESSLNFVEKYFDKFKGLVLNMAEGKRNGISVLLELQDNLLRISQPSLPAFDLDKLKNIYKSLRTCASDHLHDFDICMEESVTAVKIIKERLIEILEKSFKEINTFDQNEDACLRHFIVEMVSTKSNCTHDFLKNCLIHGFKKSRIEEIDDENLIDVYWNLQNRLLACRVDNNEAFIESCVSETLLSSNEARYIGCNIRSLSEESLQSRSNKIYDVLNNETHCIRNIFEKIKYHGLFMGGSDKEEFKECMEKYYVSNTEAPTLKDVVNKLKTIETGFIKCNQSAKDPNCFAEIIAANERSLVYIEINFVKFQGLAMKMLKGKHNGGASALKDLQDYLEMDNALTLDLYELNKMYKSVQTCVKDGKADFSKCMEVTEKLNKQKDRLTEISEKYSEKINNFDLQKNSCFRHFITKIVFPEFNSDLADCFKNGFRDNANEKLIQEFKNLQHALSACRADFNKSKVEKCISEELDSSNKIQTLLHTSSGENLKKLKSQIDVVFDTENDCMGYVFEKLLFRALFINNLTKNNFKICMDKRYEPDTEKAIKDVITTFKEIIRSLNYRNKYLEEESIFDELVADVIDTNKGRLDYIDKHFDKLKNLPTDAYFKCVSEIKSRKENRSCSIYRCTYPDITRCLKKWGHYVFEPNDIEVREKQLNVRYSCHRDEYERYIKEGSNVRVIDTYNYWQSIPFYSNNIEHYYNNWKCFLSRYDYMKRAEIAWKFDFSKTNLKIKDLSLRFDNKTLEDGAIEVSVQNAGGSKEVIGSKDLVITGKFPTPGNINRDQSQLFPQAENSKEYSFDLNVELGL